jgi:hypothetical protein
MKKPEVALRVFWMRNIPNTPEYIPVDSVDSGLQKLEELAAKDLKNDEVHSNCGWLQYFDSEDDCSDEGWCEFDMDKHFDGIDFREQCEELGLTFSEEIFNNYFKNN